MFRLLLEGPTTSRETPFNFCMSNLELYGFLCRCEDGQAPVEAQPPAVAASTAKADPIAPHAASA